MSESDKVGKGRPPKKNQFGRGQRRAPGRPKGARGEKFLVREIAADTHQVQLNGHERSVTTFELLLISARNLAMDGNLKAAKWISEYRTRLDPEEEVGGFLVVPEDMPAEMFVKKAMFENQFKTNPELRIDPKLAPRSDS